MTSCMFCGKVMFSPNTTVMQQSCRADNAWQSSLLMEDLLDMDTGELTARRPTSVY